MKIIEHPHPSLRRIAREVDFKNQENLQSIVDGMAYEMYIANGIGLAAPQVDVDLRVFVIDIRGDGYDLKVFVNPEITESSGRCDSSEGCLSLPDVQKKRTRAEHVKVKAFDQFGQPFEIEASGLLAIAIQHENDHLNGVLMID